MISYCKGFIDSRPNVKSQGIETSEMESDTGYSDETNTTLCQIDEENVSATEKHTLGNIDQDLLIKQVLDRCIIRLVEDIAPRYLLDRFTEKGCMLFCQIRDISETQLTSDKNREIYHAIRRNTNNYVTFKDALVETRQTNLVNLLTVTEESTHDELKGLGYGCQCSSANECKLLQELSGSPSEHVRLTPSTAVQELQQLLIQIYKECYLHLPINPLTAEITEPMTNLYVEPTMKIVEFARATSIQIDDNLIQEGDGFRVHSLADILTPTAKKIFIIGEAGMGKTAYCRHIVRTWCDSHIQSRSKECAKDSDEMVIANFDLLFYIHLKDYESCGDIETMIGELVRKDIAELLQNQRCLVVLDGLDEWSPSKDYKRPLLVTKGLPNRIITNRYTVLTTTRPWKLANVKPKPSDIDVLVQISGLDSNAKHQLTNNLLSVLGNGDLTDTEPFFSDIHQTGLESHIRVPSALAQLVCLWYSEQSLGESLLETYAAMIERCLALSNQDGKHTSREVKVASNDCPPCFRKLHCQLFWDLLLALSQMAYNSLFSRKKQDTEITSPILSLDDKRLAMEAGLLSESVVYNRGMEREHKMRFVHKPFQEVLAALYMTTEENESIENVISLCSSIDSILDIGNTIIFLCGMQNELCENLSRRIMAVIDDDEQIKEYREYRGTSANVGIAIIEKMQSLVLNCVEETLSSKTSFIHARVHLHDIVINHNTARCLSQVLRKTNEKTMRSVIRTEELKTVFMKTDTWTSESPGNDLLLELFREVEDSRQLEKLHLDDSRHALTPINVYGLICQSYSTLRTLCLEWINLDGLGKRFSLVLEKLSLVSLCLRHARLAHSQLNDLKLGLYVLQELELREVRCADCSFETCRYSLQIDDTVQLKRLILSGVDVEEVKFPGKELTSLETGPLNWPNATSIFSNIPSENNVAELVCSDCDDIVALNALLSRLPKLRSVRLSRTDFGKSVITLSSHLTSLDFVRLEYVTMSRKAALALVDSIHSLALAVHVEFFAVASEYDLLVITYYLRRNPSKFLIIKDTAKEICFETRHSIDIKDI